MYRPVILLGHGVRNNPKLVSYLCGLGIPVLTTWPAMDLLTEDDPVFCGRPGMHSQRAANIIVQKASELFVFGARLDTETVAFDLDGFASKAAIHVYDIDQAELDKLPDRFAKTHVDLNTKHHFEIWFDLEWLSWCKSIYARFRDEYDGVNAHPVYRFVQMLSNTLPEGEIIAPCSSGTLINAFIAAFKVKKGQDIHTSSNIGAMGMDVPWAIGAALATGKHVTSLVGDGGFQMNFQELEVVRRLKLPITFWVGCNNGYASIRNSQRARFGRLTGADPSSGATFIPVSSIQEMFPEVDIRIYDMDPNFQMTPMVMSSMVDGKMRTDKLEDMTPKIDDLKELMAYGND
jgi:acetolactate synthase-1/2/3 large subunit